MARKQREEFTLEERQRIHVMLSKGCGFAEIGETTPVVIYPSLKFISLSQGRWT
jgi:hypothetical protein